MVIKPLLWLLLVLLLGASFGPLSAQMVGEVVSKRGTIDEDVYAAGRSVFVSGQVASHVVAAGEVVDIAPAATIGGWAWLAGREVTIAGRIGRELKAAGQRVILSGEVTGDVDIMAEEIRVLESARIGGDLVYRSGKEPDIAEGARIAGDTIARPMLYREPGGRGAGLVLYVALLVAVVVYFILFPAFSIACADTLRQSPLSVLGVGMIVLFTMPFVIVQLFASLVGVLLALPLLAGYLVSLLAGLLTAVIFAGDMVLRFSGTADAAGRGKRILSIAIALAVILLFRLIPVVGGWVMLLLFVLGFGAFHLQLWQIYTNRNNGAQTPGI